MRDLILDASAWKTDDDVYDSFFKAVGAPEWHGRNFNALIDSIQKGEINAVEVLYRVVIRHYDCIAPGTKKMADDFADLIREIAGRGCPVKIVVEK
jgi:hypothetical protein